MLFPRVKRLGRELDWYKSKNAVFGMYKNYFYNVGDGQGIKIAIVRVGELSEGQKTQINEALKANKKALKLSRFDFMALYIQFQFAEHFKSTKLERFYNLFDFLAELFEKANVPEQNRCHGCETKDHLRFYAMDSLGMILCNSCFRKMEDDFNRAEREKHEREKNYAAGFLGSLVFSIPGIIAWVLFAVYLERVAAVMAMAIAALGKKGYDYFKGRHDKATRYLIIVSNIICVFVACVATIFALLLKEGLSFGESYGALLTNENAIKAFKDNLFISYFMAFLGWIWIFASMGEKKMAVGVAEKVKE